MTENMETMVIPSSSDNGSQDGGAAPAQMTPPVSSEEKLLPQSRVNELVGQTRKQARDEGYERAQREFESRQNVPGMAPSQDTLQISKQDFNRLLDERVREEKERNLKEEEARYANEVAGSFVSKMSSGFEKYPDYEAKVQALNITSAPMVAVIPYLHEIDNVADVVYEFANNPRKLIELQGIAQMSPALARQHLQQLSASIAQNEQASNSNRPKPPLDQVSPSIAGMDSGEKSISALRKNPLYRV